MKVKEGVSDKVHLSFDQKEEEMIRGRSSKSENKGPELGKNVDVFEEHGEWQCSWRPVIEGRRDYEMR